MSMKDDIGLTLRFIPVEDTQAHEVAALTDDIWRALEKIQEVSEVDAVSAPAPEGSKTGEMKELGALLTRMAPTALQKALQVVCGILKVPGTPPTEVEVVQKGKSVKLKFDPRTISSAELAKLVNRIAQ